MKIKLILPIIALCLLGFFGGAYIIEKTLNEQIYAHQKEEIHHYANRIYHTLRADYKTFFFQYGKDSAFFAHASTVAQQESLANIQEMLSKSPYQGIITINNNTKMEVLNTSTLHKQQLKQLNALRPNQPQMEGGYYLYKMHFKPWGWDIIILRDTKDLQGLIRQNTFLVFATIGLLMLFIVVFLYFVIIVIVEKPFAAIFEHLKRLARNLSTPPLELNSSKEIHLLSRHINAMSDGLLLKEEALAEQKAFYNTILKAQPTIVIVTSGKKINYANSAFFNFLNQFQSLEEFGAKYNCICDLFEPIDNPDFLHKSEDGEWLKQTLQSVTPRKAAMKKDGVLFIFSVMASSIGKENDEYVVTFSDITSLERYKELLEEGKAMLNQQLRTDELTGLPNRLSLSEHIAKTEYGSLVLINLNDFKELNDFYGVTTGDKVLREYGALLSQIAQSEGFNTFKLSGDEYALYTDEVVDEEQLVSQVQSIQKNMDKQSFYDVDNGRLITVASTAGLVSHSPSETLFVQADIALKTGKKKHKRIMTYTDSQDTQNQFASNIKWADRLKSAFVQNRIVPYFQPIFNNHTKKIDKYEALVRLIDEHGRAITPFHFLDVAKKSHLYFQLTETMLNKTFDYFQSLPYSFSINLSESDLIDYSVNALIIEKLSTSNIGHRVIFEIVETENIEDYELVAHFINEVKQYGSKIAIDDFGTGFSNFKHISRLNIDFIKIDGSLIKHILDDSNSQAIVETIHTFASRLNIKTIAEFVDNQAVFDKINEIGIDFTQGYFIGKPSPDVITKKQP
jgi:diguanylate cyclase (GGDEF)-like protein